MSALLRVTSISKRFPGVVALDGVSVDFYAGSCHALMGENGAGKSTLGKIIAGLYTPDEGGIEFEGKPVHFSGPRAAVLAGISMVHQELSFAENLTVADNLCLGDLPRRGLWIDDRAAEKRAREYLASIEFDIDPNTIVGDLSISKQQMVQIAGGAGRGARVLIFDEPTSSLSQAEATKLLEVIRELKAKGVCCIYVSHRLDEVFAVCDTVTVLRDGKKVGTHAIADITRDDLVRMMVGREVPRERATDSNSIADHELLRIGGLTSPGKFRDVTFSVKSGEILGIAGLVGAGRTEVVEALFGLDPSASGTVSVKGRSLELGDPVEAMRSGLGLVPEDRKRHGLVLMMNARENISLPTLAAVATATVVDRQKERSLAQKFFDRMRVKAPSLDTVAATLSGGNQQKLVIAKWLAANCDVLLVDEPTRGVDVGAKEEIHNLLRSLAAEGKAVICVSSDMPELLALSNRVLVMREGLMVGEVTGERIQEEQVMRMMAGI